MSSGSHPDGTRGQVRDGLRRLVARAGPPPGGPGDAAAAARVRWRNLLLDEVGSDARALVDLLVRVHAHGVAAEIPVGPLAPAAWGPVRGRLAFAYASDTFLDPAAARWAVDAWAYALGAIDAAGLYVEPASAAAPPPPSPPAARVAAPAAPPVRGAAPAGGIGAAGPVPGRVRRAMARANAPPPPNPFPANFDRIAGLTFVGMVALAAVAMWVGITDRREAGGLEVPAPAAFAEAAPAPLAPIAPLLPGRDAAPAGAGPVSAPDVAAAAGLDTLRLRDGTVRAGVVERVTAAGLVVRDPWSDATARVDLADVVEWRARPGAVLPVGEAPAEGAPAGADAAAAAAPAAAAPDADVFAAAPAGAGDLGRLARTGGLAGRYTVRRRVLDVRGSESCGAVAAAVRAAAPTVETVAHRPGEAEFTMPSRPGLRGTVDEDGRFRTDAVVGERGGVRYRFRMAGQFLPQGFRAETESETRAVLRWGDVQQCQVSVALDAERVP